MYLLERVLPVNSRIIILENLVGIDGIGDYSHLRDILKAVTTNPRLAAYTFIPVIQTGNAKLIETIKADFESMKITRFYIGDHGEFKIDTALDKALQPVYENAEQVIEVSTHFFYGEQKRFLNPAALVKSILEHEASYSIAWEAKSGLPTLTTSLGLHPNALGIKVSDVEKTAPHEFFASLQTHDHEFATKLLKTTGSNNFTELTAKNIFSHAYFTDFGEINGFSMFLALLCTNPNSKNKDTIVHLSSSAGSALTEYTRKSRHQTNHGISRLQTILKEAGSFQSKEFFAQHVHIKQIEFFGQEDHDPQHIEPINPSGGNSVIRIYNAHLSQASYKLVFDACTFVGVSGDNSFEHSVAHRVLPFYHSTNGVLKGSTWRAIKEIIKSVNFGFPSQLVRDLTTYFSYEAGHDHGYDFLRKLLLINLDSVQEAWPAIADYLNQHRNFYNLYEQLILMPAPPLEELADSKKIALATCDQNHRIIPKTTESLPKSQVTAVKSSKPPINSTTLASTSPLEVNSASSAYSSASHVTLFAPALVPTEDKKGSTIVQTTGLQNSLTNDTK